MDTKELEQLFPKALPLCEEIQLPCCCFRGSTFWSGDDIRAKALLPCHRHRPWPPEWRTGCPMSLRTVVSVWQVLRENPTSLRLKARFLLLCGIHLGASLRFVLTDPLIVKDSK